jgi:hypothetical protein
MDADKRWNRGQDAGADARCAAAAAAAEASHQQHCASTAQRPSLAQQPVRASLQLN